MANMPTHAMVFAAGFGKRMLPLTNTMPKPMIPVAGRPMIDRALDHLAAAGVTTAVVNTHHLPEMMQRHVLSRQGGTKILISHEDPILETGGGIVKALPLLGHAPFFTYNGDIILLDGKQPVLQRMAEAWDASRMDVLMLLHPVEKAVGYDGKGDFDLTGDGRILKTKADHYPYVFTGVMIIKPEVFAGMKPVPFSVYREAIQPKYQQADGSLERVYGLVHDGKWLHIGTPEGIAEAEAAMQKTSCN